MRPSDCIGCKAFPCADVNHLSYVIPGVEITPETVHIVLISEAAPANLVDYYYAQGAPLFEQTTVQAFRDAGAEVSSMQDILDLGVYLTTAVKCGKMGYGIETSTIKECSHILEQELALFPNATVWSSCPASGLLAPCTRRLARRWPRCWRRQSRHFRPRSGAGD